MTDRPIRFLLPDIALGAEMKNSALVLCQRFLARMETHRIWRHTGFRQVGTRGRNEKGLRNAPTKGTTMPRINHPSNVTYLSVEVSSICIYMGKVTY